MVTLPHPPLPTASCLSPSRLRLLPQAPRYPHPAHISPLSLFGPWPSSDHLSSSLYRDLTVLFLSMAHQADNRQAMRFYGVQAAAVTRGSPVGGQLMLPKTGVCTDTPPRAPILHVTARSPSGDDRQAALNAQQLEPERQQGKGLSHGAARLIRDPPRTSAQTHVCKCPPSWRASEFPKRLSICLFLWQQPQRCCWLSRPSVSG